MILMNACSILHTVDFTNCDKELVLSLQLLVLVCFFVPSGLGISRPVV